MKRTTSAICEIYVLLTAELLELLREAGYTSGEIEEALRDLRRAAEAVIAAPEVSPRRAAG